MVRTLFTMHTALRFPDWKNHCRLFETSICKRNWLSTLPAEDTTCFALTSTEDPVSEYGQALVTANCEAPVLASGASVRLPPPSVAVPAVCFVRVQAEPSDVPPS